MDQEYQIVHNDKPDDAAETVVGLGLHQFNIQQAGENDYQRLCFFLHAPDGEIAGGLIGNSYWDWFYISLLWVKEELRGRGYGYRLMEAAEEEARQRGVKNAYLDTFDFQAPEFYEKLGYQLFGELKEFPPGHQRFFLTKQL